MNSYLLVKALHIIGVVSWFAGLLYIVRLFIYHQEAEAKPEPERSILKNQFIIMERRLWLGITWPAMIATSIFGVWLMIVTHAWSAPWFHLKIIFLVALILYHFYCGKIRKDLLKGVCALSSIQLRVWNEVATLLLFAIVFTAVLKNPSITGKGMLALGFLSVILITIIIQVRKSKLGKNVISSSKNLNQS